MIQQCHPGIYAREMKIYILRKKKNLYIIINNNIIHNSKKVETNQMSIN